MEDSHTNSAAPAAGAPESGLYWSADGVSRNEAARRLARFMFETMQDANVMSGEWCELTEGQKDFYIDVIEALSDRRTLWSVIFDGADDNAVCRRSIECE